METNHEQWMAIKFCFKNELTATEMFKMLQKVYSNECLSHTNVFEWYGKFHNGWESVDDDPRSGRLRTTCTREHITKVRAALADDWRSMIRMLAKRFHIDKGTIRKIITEDLGGKKFCVWFVPHALMSELWEDRVTSCRNFLQKHENVPEFLNKIITDDETWCFAYDPESKCHSVTWVGPQLPKVK